MKVKGQKLKIFAKKARAANKRRVAFFPKIATRWIYFIHIFRQLLVPNLSKSEKKSSVLALVPYYTDYKEQVSGSYTAKFDMDLLLQPLSPLTSGNSPKIWKLIWKQR